MYWLRDPSGIFSIYWLVRLGYYRLILFLPLENNIHIFAQLCNIYTIADLSVSFIADKFVNLSHFWHEFSLFQYGKTSPEKMETLRHLSLSVPTEMTNSWLAAPFVQAVLIPSSIQLQIHRIAPFRPVLFFASATKKWQCAKIWVIKTVRADRLIDRWLESERA